MNSTTAVFDRRVPVGRQPAVPSVQPGVPQIVAGPVLLRVGSAFLNGVGAEVDLKKALICFQQAEAYLYDMVAGGNVMYKKSLQAAIDGQTKARAKLTEALPDKEWTFS